LRAKAVVGRAQVGRMIVAGIVEQLARNKIRQRLLPTASASISLRQGSPLRTNRIDVAAAAADARIIKTIWAGRLSR